MDKFSLSLCWIINWLKPDKPILKNYIFQVSELYFNFKVWTHYVLWILSRIEIGRRYFNLVDGMILSYISEHCDSVDPYIMKNVFQSIKKKAGAGGLKSLYGKYRGRWRKSSKKLCPFDFCFLRPTNFRNSTANDRRNIERYAWMNTSGWWLPSAEFWCLFIKVYIR